MFGQRLSVKRYLCLRLARGFLDRLSHLLGQLRRDLLRGFPSRCTGQLGHKLLTRLTTLAGTLHSKKPPPSIGMVV